MTAARNRSTPSFLSIASALLAAVLLGGTAVAQTESPTTPPTGQPTQEPTESPSEQPTEQPTQEPTESPSGEPTQEPTESETPAPSETATATETPTPEETPLEPVPCDADGDGNVDDGLSTDVDFGDYVPECESGAYDLTQCLIRVYTRDGETTTRVTCENDGDPIGCSEADGDDDSFDLDYIMDIGGWFGLEGNIECDHDDETGEIDCTITVNPNGTPSEWGGAGHCCESDGRLHCDITHSEGEGDRPWAHLEVSGDDDCMTVQVTSGFGRDNPDRLSIRQWTYCCREEPCETPTPTPSPSEEPTESPTQEPSESPTEEPTESPTEEPTEEPTWEPTESPTEEPTYEPTWEPTESPTEEPTYEPTWEPTESPTEEPTYEPTWEPTESPTEEPTYEPTWEPTESPTEEPTYEPTWEPTP